MCMLTMKNITNNIIYTIQELHIFLKSFIFEL